MGLLFSGCTKTVTVIKWKTKTVKEDVYLPCIVPRTECTVKGSDTEIIEQLLGCFYKQREDMKVCQ